MLLVEAKGPWAVQTVERILLTDGKVSENCSVLMVHMDCPLIGLRDDIVEQVSYVDFMLDVVSPDRLLADALVTTSFRQSLTDEERQYASLKLSAMNANTRREQAPQAQETAPKASPGPVSPAQTPPALPMPQTAPNANYEQLMGGLLHLGFKRPDVKKFIDNLGPKLYSSKLEDLIREGLKELAA